jgi:hypothetical protein
MTGVLLPLAVTAAAGAVTYWCCIRPMRRDTSSAPGGGTGDASQATDIERQLATAREERAQLRGATGPNPAGDVDVDVTAAVGTPIEQQLAAAREELEQLRATSRSSSGLDAESTRPRLS